MALTRKFLKSLGLEEDKIDSIIEAHTETVDGLKTQITDLQGKVDELKSGEDGLKTKAAEAAKALEAFKAEVASKEAMAKTRAAYRELLTEAHVTEAAIESVLNATDFSKMKLAPDGSLADKEALAGEIPTKWGGFITTTQTRGANVQTPPSTPPSGANPRAAEIARKFNEARYGTPQNPGQQTT